MRYLLLILCVAFVSATPSLADDCPCGPDGLPPFLKRLVPQGAFGADFRPACRRHDACYASGYGSRKQCDQNFRNDLHNACQNSSHPLLCRMAANHRYRTVRLFGGSAFRRAQ